MCFLGGVKKKKKKKKKKLKQIKANKTLRQASL